LQPKSRSNKLALKREGIGTAGQERTHFLEKSQERKTFHYFFFLLEVVEVFDYHFPKKKPNYFHSNFCPVRKSLLL